jgi:hypothetical protein
MDQGAVAIAVASVPVCDSIRTAHESLIMLINAQALRDLGLCLAGGSGVCSTCRRSTFAM